MYKCCKLPQASIFALFGGKSKRQPIVLKNLLRTPLRGMDNYKYLITSKLYFLEKSGDEVLKIGRKRDCADFYIVLMDSGIWK